MTMYYVEFIFERKVKIASWSNGISGVKDGFWLDEDLNISTDENGKYWIPVSQIILIEKDTMHKLKGNHG